jgi:aryl-alcohol dehydrogenase-like predicted oxidoreductase
MEYRELGRTGFQVSSISFGAWAIGGTWGTVDDRDSMASLHKALDLGINFFDTADVYGDGRSERLIAQLRRERSEPFFVATKAGRRLPKQTLAGYTRDNLHNFVGRSLKNLELDSLDLLQLHCPSPDVYESDAVFEILDEMVKLGMVKHYGITKTSKPYKLFLTCSGSNPPKHFLLPPAPLKLVFWLEFHWQVAC